MSWWSILIVIVFILFLVGRASLKGRKKRSSSRSAKSKRKHSNTKTIQEEAQEIVDKITTLRQAKSLENRILKAQEKTEIVESERQYDNVIRKLEILSHAETLLDDKVLAYQFVPTLDLDTPANVLKAAYKVFPLDKIDDAKLSLSQNSNDWFGMTHYDEKEEPESHLNALKKFRSIIEGDDSEDEKAKKVNSLVKRSKLFEEEFFYDDDFTPWEQLQIQKISALGAPKAGELFREGVIHPKDYLMIDPDDFMKRPGVGPKTKQDLIEFQEKVRQM